MRLQEYIAIIFVASVLCCCNGITTAQHHSQLHNADGSWKYTNRLADSTSPYLLQHAHNPVDWYPWGDEALQAAKEQDKPIFLSIGYSTCYWCHVMEREVFENPEIAAIMNEQFICIKVDREQRPDIDEVYMTATQLMTQRGGWPMSVFLTPELEPFYAGTYFGATDRGGQPRFPTILAAMHGAWTNEPDKVLDVSQRVTAAIRENLLGRLEQIPTVDLTDAVSDRAVVQLASRHDERWGGFGVAPKFPQGFTYPFLLATYERTEDAKTLEMAIGSLEQMAAGGMYDHVGGGFHRYATDGQWRVPHFEKMLYNQAQLAIAYAWAYEVTGDKSFADTAHGVLGYVAEHMTGPEGQFYSALDAETDAIEGAYYVWNGEQLSELLGADELKLFDQVFALEDVPIFAGHLHPDGGTLYMRKPMTQLASDLDMPYAELRERTDALLAKLKTSRDQRKLPRLDDKVVAGWNGLMIGAMAQAGQALKEPAYIDAAKRAAEFLLEHMTTEDGRLLRVWRAGVSEQAAFHEDYAFVIQGLAVLSRATDEARWLDAAVALADHADRLFWDAEAGGYYFAVEAADLIARSKSARDSAIPSGNSAMANALLDLAELTDEDRWLVRAQETLTTFSGVVSGSPAGHLHMVHAVQRYVALAGPIERVDRPLEIPMQSMAPMEPKEDAQASPTDSASHVQIEAALESSMARVGDTFTVLVSLDIADGWHLNANPASSKELIATTVDVRSELPIEVVSVEYPEPMQMSASYSPSEIDVFEGDVEIRVVCKFTSTSEDGRTTLSAGGVVLRVLIGFQACDEQSCLAPAQQVIEIPVVIQR